ncbi:MAG: hypothetical protein M9939_13860 [Mesorhizobium sp.]|nr:hypothetical protein [Mesorhizobium sp.]MCO5162218.1 hypothetical protein [Mesorhizobium sp.]
MNEFRTRLVLLEDYARRSPNQASPDTADLKKKLSSLPELGEVELAPDSQSTVIATVPMKSPRDREKVKALINEKVDGWQVIEESTYNLPKTF